AGRAGDLRQADASRRRAGGPGPCLTTTRGGASGGKLLPELLQLRVLFLPQLVHPLLERLAVLGVAVIAATEEPGGDLALAHAHDHLGDPPAEQVPEGGATGRI